MEADKTGSAADIERNSKPFLIKRLIADGFDTVLIFGLFMLFTALIMQSPLAEGYNAHYERITAIESETEQACGSDAEAIEKALRENREYLDERFAASLNSYVLKAAAAFPACALTLLAVPLLNRGRATPGKLMTGVMPFNERRRRRALWYQILLRFLFVYFIDGLGLYMFTGIWTFALVPVLRLIEILCTKKNKTVCDGITGIMIIEKLSYSGID